MTYLFSFILFLSAGMVLWVQPMFGKMVQPLLGGTPAVWNTCLLFFQAALLLGYLYAHLLSGARFGRQVCIHVGLLLCFLAFLPVGLPHGWSPPATNPVPWLLSLLAISLGPPFLIVSATAPLLQRWFSLSGRPESGDPYFLYAAGNAGSLAGLFCYPLLMEPYLPLSGQSLLWTASYVVLAVCIAATGVGLWGRTGPACDRRTVESAAPGILERGRWVLLAAVPSSLLQSVTLYMTVDVAAVPLLWVIPLGLYLLSFIVVFARRQVIPHRVMVAFQPVALCVLAMVVFQPGDWNLSVSVAVSLSALFVTATALHGELVESRPGADRLTEFYLLLALGGVLGGILSAIVAPLVFNRLLEFPLMIMLAALLIPQRRDGTGVRFSAADVLLPATPAILGFGLLMGIHHWAFPLTPRGDWVIEKTLAVVIGLTTLAALLWRGRSLGCSIGLGAYMLMGFLAGYIHSTTIYTERSFYGIIAIQRNNAKGVTSLRHGTTSHGSQFLDPRFRGEPTSYYSRSGPVGDLFSALPEHAAGRTVGVIGLGAGVMASYARAHDHWIFYELHPGVARAARDPAFFTFLADSPARIDMIPGDGRLSLSRAPEGFFDVIVLDAFSSDSVPVHLLTREALELYFSKLKPNGVLALHITNRYLNLLDVVAAVAGSVHANGRYKDHDPSEGERILSDADSSDWVVLSRDESFPDGMSDAGWKPLQTRDLGPAWTDDYSGLVRHFKSHWK